MVHILVWFYAFWKYLNGTHISLVLCFLEIFDLNGTHISLGVCFLGFEWYTHISLVVCFLGIFEWYTY